MFFLSHRFSHWFNNELIHNNVTVSSKWMITKGTLGLGCHKKYSSVGCHTSYDNIKVKKYRANAPSASLGKLNVSICLYVFLKIQY